MERYINHINKKAATGSAVSGRHYIATKKAVPTYKPGDIVELGGIDFVVLDNSLSSGKSLFILTVDTQGTSQFGETNDYSTSFLRKATEDWLRELQKAGVDLSALQTRKLDLMTLDGYKGYGSLDVTAAPLTLDEARKYAELIPNCIHPSWLATGWSGPKRLGSILVWCLVPSGMDNGHLLHQTNGIRPALVVPASLVTKRERNEDGCDPEWSEAGKQFYRDLMDPFGEKSEQDC